MLLKNKEGLIPGAKLVSAFSSTTYQLWQKAKLKSHQKVVRELSAGAHIP
jgi:hypothetical protein